MNNHSFKPKWSTLLTCAIAAASLGGAANATEYNDPYWASPNANTDFVDHFDSPTLNREAWLVEKDIFVNGEDQDYQDVEFPAADWTIGTAQPDEDALDGKALILKARYMDGEIQDYYGGNGKPLFIRAGRIESQITDATTFTYGKFEARIKTPPARNAEFPAWWLLGNYPDVGWTACQELDIMEFTGAEATAVPQTYWTAPYPVHGGVSTPYADLGITNPETEYVTYGIIKTPDSVEYYVNGIKTQTFSRANQGDDQPWPYVTPMRMILNHAITHAEWPAVGNYNAVSTDPSVPNRTGASWQDAEGVWQYEYINTDAMAANIGREGTDFIVDYVAHWPLPASDPMQKYTDDSKYSFFRSENNTKGFYNLRGWLAPVAVTADDYLHTDWADDERDHAPDNAADGYVGSKWATPADDNAHWVEIDYGSDKQISYLWIDWSWNLPSVYDIFGKSETTGAWEHIVTSTQTSEGWAEHVFDVNKPYRYIKLVTRGRINKAEPIWLLELKAFEDVVNMYPKPVIAGIDRSENILSNGTFDTDLSNWGTEAYDGSDPTYTSVNGEAVISLTNDGANAGSVQMHTSNFGLQKDYRYTVSFDAKAAAARNIQVRLSKNDLNPNAEGTYLLETIALSEAMTNYSFSVDFTAMDESGRLAFLFGEMGTDTVTIDNVVISEGEFIGSGETLVPVIGPSNLISYSTGWETDWWGVVGRIADGDAGSKASGNDGEAEGLDLDITVKIEENFEVREVWISGDNSPDRSLDQFKVEYGDGTTLIDWTPSTTDGTYEIFNTFANTPDVGERDFKFYFRPPAGQLVEVGNVQLMAVDLMPHRISSVALDEDAVISPAETLRYSNTNTDDATYTFSAPEGRTVNNVIIDGESKGAITEFTFTDISASHVIAVGLSPAVIEDEEEETEEPETEEPETEEPETEQPETEQPETEEPETEQPEESNGGSKKSGGGSLGWFALLTLLGLRIRKRQLTANS